MRCVVVLLVLIGLGVCPALAEDPADSFKGFCEEWMAKLMQREQRNLSHIQWEAEESGVRGGYVGYTPDHTCITKNGTGSVPVGKISYLEVRYEKRGETIEAAERSLARPVETTEITEIFRYAGGKWIY